MSRVINVGIMGDESGCVDPFVAALAKERRAANNDCISYSQVVNFFDGDSDLQLRMLPVIDWNAAHVKILANNLDMLVFCFDVNSYEEKGRLDHFKEKVAAIKLFNKQTNKPVFIVFVANSQEDIVKNNIELIYMQQYCVDSRIKKAICRLNDALSVHFTIFSSLQVCKGNNNLCHTSRLFQPIQIEERVYYEVSPYASPYASSVSSPSSENEVTSPLPTIK